MSYNQEHDSTGTVRSTVTPASHTPKTPTKRDSFDEYMWRHHDDRHHTGGYTECATCTDAWILVTDHPRFLAGF